MGKTILLTEAQYSRLQNVISENTTQDFKDFVNTVELEFELSSKEYDGRHIYGVETPEKWSGSKRIGDYITVTFDMDFHITKYGIHELQIINVKGPSLLDVNIEVEPLTDDDEDVYFQHRLDIDWSKAEVLYDEGDGALPRSIDRIVIYLDDYLFVDKILVYPYFN